MISNEKLSHMIADAKSERLLVVSALRKEYIEALEELVKYRSIIDMSPEVENADAEKYLPTSQMSGYMGE
jgi:hypothetical protein